MDRVGFHAEGCLHDRLDLQIALGRARRTDAQCAICEPRRHGGAIRGGCRQHGLDPELPAGTNDSRRDLAPIRDEDATNAHGGYSLWPTRSRTSPYSTNSPSLARISVTRPRTPARTVFMSFMTSMMPMMVSSSTAEPSSTNGGAPGFGAR